MQNCGHARGQQCRDPGAGGRDRQGDRLCPRLPHAERRLTATRPGRAPDRQPAPPASSRSSSWASLTIPRWPTWMRPSGKYPVEVGPEHPVFLLFSLLRHPGELSGRWQRHWNEWHPPVRELLLNKQNADGTWAVPAGTRRGQRGRRRPQQGLLDRHGVAGPGDLHALPAGVSAVSLNAEIAGGEGPGRSRSVRLSADFSRGRRR